MHAGISTSGLRVARVPIGNDEWVQQFVQEKAAAVQVDVDKLDIISDGRIHYQMLRFCQNTRLAFLGCNTPTPLISAILAEVDAMILEALCRKGTTDVHGEWTAVFRRLLSFAVLLTINCNWHTFGEDSASLPMLVVPFLLSMRHLCLSCNGSVSAVIRPCQHMGPRPRFNQSGPMDCSYYDCSQASSPHPSHRFWMS